MPKGFFNGQNWPLILVIYKYSERKHDQWKVDL